MIPTTNESIIPANFLDAILSDTPVTFEQQLSHSPSRLPVSKSGKVWLHWKNEAV
jgi:hypothetical protein